MASAIGVRIYRISVHGRRATGDVDLHDGELELPATDFITNFVATHNTPVESEELERTFYFEEKEAPSTGSSRGYIHYGTFGYESNIIDPKTKEKKYRRMTTDVEEIPLYYEFWCPSSSKTAFAAFQSFGGKSCIGLVMKKMRDRFEVANPGYLLVFQKVTASNARGTAYFSAPVKRLHLLRRKAPNDLASRYFEGLTPDVVDYEVTISARRKMSLGALNDLLTSFDELDQGVILEDGVEFKEAYAEVRFGKKLRRVGVLGENVDAGVIDLTETVLRAPDGHPHFESMRKEVNELLEDFYHVMRGHSR